LLFLACGGSTAATTRDGGSDGDSGSGPCEPSPGNYIERFTPRSGTNCPGLDERALTIDDRGMIPDTGFDASGGIAGCGTSKDTSTCTFITDCGGAGIDSTTITFDGSSATGTRTLPNGCAYAVTVTKN
jgi:hypothetical protein